MVDDSVTNKRKIDDSRLQDFITNTAKRVKEQVDPKSDEPVSKDALQKERLARFQALMQNKANAAPPQALVVEPKREPFKPPPPDVLESFFEDITKTLAENSAAADKQRLQKELKKLRKKEKKIKDQTLTIENIPIASEETPENSELLGTSDYRKHFLAGMEALTYRPEIVKDKAVVAAATKDDSSDDDQNFEEPDVYHNDEESYFDLVQKSITKRVLPRVDHSQMTYEPFEKNIYVQSREITRLSEHEVLEIREKNVIKVTGKKCPPPISSFYQLGLHSRLLSVIEKNDWLNPFAIQMQMIPALLCGRDVIGLAETGSGKTLAYTIPMIRNVLAQPPLSDGDGPIGLVFSPTRELAIQINKAVAVLAKSVGLKVALTYGGAPVGPQLSQLRAGAHICVFTPGRMIDVLMTSNGKITNLRRVTFVVLDEADRLLDLGFEPQIDMIVENVQPNKQLCLCTATLPPHVEGLARHYMKKPLEITVGNRKAANINISQHIEVLADEESKFVRLLQLFGEWKDQGGAIVVFFSRQREVDDAFKSLLSYGYQCLTLHGGHDQEDRYNTLSDFKLGKCPFLLATSIASRGLDMDKVILVINYTAPDNLNDYVHRIGRCGRAGRQGFAYSFILPSEGSKADGFIDILSESGQTVPNELIRLRDHYSASVAEGIISKKRNFKFAGYSEGRGHKFDKTEISNKMRRDMNAREDTRAELGLVARREEPSPIEDDLSIPININPELPVDGAAEAGTSATPPAGEAPETEAPPVPPKSAAIPEVICTPMSNPISTPLTGALRHTAATGSSGELSASNINLTVTRRPGAPELPAMPPPPKTVEPAKPPPTQAESKSLGFRDHDVIQYTKRMGCSPQEADRIIAQQDASTPQLQKATNIAVTAAQTHVPAGPKNVVCSVQNVQRTQDGEYFDELEINDYPELARLRMSHKATIPQFEDAIPGCRIQVKGQYYAPNCSFPVIGDCRRLYVHIVGLTPHTVATAKLEIYRFMEEIAKSTLKKVDTNNQRSNFGGRYSVL